MADTDTLPEIVCDVPLAALVTLPVDQLAAIVNRAYLNIKAGRTAEFASMRALRSFTRLVIATGEHVHDSFEFQSQLRKVHGLSITPRGDLMYTVHGSSRTVYL